MKSRMKRVVATMVTLCIVICEIFVVIANGSNLAWAYTSYKTLPELTGNQREDIALVAESQIGYKKDDGTIFGEWYTNYVQNGVDYTELAWCAMFATWCAKRAGVEEGILPAHAGCALGVNQFKDLGVWKDSSYTPKRGDLIYFTYSHVGIVVACDGETVTTVEGNKTSLGSAVGKTTYKLTNANILGYASPRYNESSGYPIPTRTLYKTSPLMNGNDVKWLQSNLSKLGYEIYPDGYLGSYTERMIIKFQSDNNLDADGYAGPATRKKIIELVGKMAVSDEQEDDVMSPSETTCSHISSGWIIDKKATYTSNGKAHKECTKCNEILETKVIPKLTRTSIDTADISISKSSYAYTGKQIKPAVYVTLDGKKLVSGQDYSVTYINNVYPGSATVKITGINAYEDTITSTFNIYLNKVLNLEASNLTTTSVKLSWTKNTLAKGYVIQKYNTSSKKYQTIYTSTSNINTYTNNKLSSGKYYMYRVRAYVVDSNGTKKYSSWSDVITTGTKTATTTATVKKQSASSIKVLWTKKNGSYGYEIARATYKSGNYKILYKKSASTNYIIDKKLTKGVSYYYKIRSYRYIGGVKVYSSWSSVKSIKL